MTERYTKDEVRRLLHDAALAQTTSEKGFSLEEVTEAAREAGITEERVKHVAKHFDRRRGLRIGLLAALAMCMAATLVLIFMPPSSLGGWHLGALSLHNEHRESAFDVEILVPSDSHVDCALAPPVRAESDQYHTWRRIRLQPGNRLHLDVPQNPRACPQVWIRTLLGEFEVDSATFELPVALEIERSGRLDQKGVGSPQKHSPPLQAVSKGGRS